MKLNGSNPISRWQSRRAGTLLEFAFDGRGQPVHLPHSLYSAHSLLIGRRAAGRKTLLTHLALRHLKEGRSLIVIDAEGEFVDALLERVPAERMHEVVYLNLGDRERLIRFNPLQVGAVSRPDVMVESVVRAARRVWNKYWAMDVEGLLRAGLATLVTANQVLAERGEPQLALVDLIHLFEQRTFRRRLLNTYIQDPLLSYFWMGFYDRQFDEQRGGEFFDCVSLLHNTAGWGPARWILGQSDSGMDWRQILGSPCIVLIKTTAHQMRRDSQELPVACLLEQLLSVVREERVDGTKERNAPLPILVNGDEPLVYPDRPGVFEEFKRLGVLLTFSTSSLAQLDSGLTPLSNELLASEPNLFLFSPIPAETRVLLPGLSDDISLDSLPVHSDRECHVRQVAGPEDLPIEWMGMLPVRKGDPQLAADLVSMSRPYSRPFEEVEAEREEFDEEWRGQEWDLLRVSFDDESESGSKLEYGDL